jgi:hypothetical protein
MACVCPVCPVHISDRVDIGREGCPTKLNLFAIWLLVWLILYR